MSDKKKRPGTDADDDVPVSDEPKGERDVDADGSPAAEGDSRLMSVDRPIGEGRDNLRRRQDWFRRRTGGAD